MSTILQWLALAACLGGTVWRLPAAVKGHNRTLFAAFALATLSVVLSIPAIYLPIDAFLGGDNFANVVLRLSLFGVFFLLALRVAAGYKSPRSLRLIRGPVGLAALCVSAVGLLTCFYFGDFEASSTGLRGITPSPALSLYAGFAQFYLAYVSACLLPATFSAAISTRPALQRIAAGSMSLGFALVCVTIPFQLLLRNNVALMAVASFAAVLFVAIGLMLVWVAFLLRPMD